MTHSSRKPATRSDWSLFARQWMKNPLGIAAMAPSSHALAQLITSRISAADVPLIELGPGTGVFTQALIDKGLPARSIVPIELNEAFAERLEQRIPQLIVQRLDAAQLKSLPPFHNEPAAAVISGLGLLSMREHTIDGILEGVLSHLKADGAIYQFTYGLGCPVPRRLLQRHQLKATRLGRTYRNLPPASVYELRRR